MIDKMKPLGLLRMNDLLGVSMYAGTLSSAVRHVVETCLQHHGRFNRYVSATGAHGLVTSKKDADFRGVLEKFYLNLPDGMPSGMFRRRNLRPYYE